MRELSHKRPKEAQETLSIHLEGGVFNYRVVGVLLNSDRVLLQRAESDPFWVLPGGRGEFGEASDATIRREFFEEIGLKVRVGRLLWVVENFFDLRQPYHEIAFYYEVHALSQMPTSKVFDGRREDRNPPLVFRWAHIEDLPDLLLYPDFLPRVLAHLPTQVTHIVHRDASKRAGTGSTGRMQRESS